MGSSLPSIYCFADEYDDFYNQASSAFEQGDYAKAVILFNKAKNLRPQDTHALDFNIGSSLYKLGNYISAYESFDSASEDPQFYVLSHINMALCAAKLHDRELLSKHLIIVTPLVNSERYRQQLINIAKPFGLQNLLAQQTPRLISHLDIALGRQYNIVLQLLDNNNSTVVPTSSSQADANYLFTQLDMNYLWRNYLSMRFTLQDMNFQSDQDQVKNYGYRTLLFSPTFYNENKARILMVSLSAIHTDIANQSFQNQAVILLKGLLKHGSWQSGVFAQQRSLYSTDVRYRYLQGSESSWGLQTQRLTSHWSAQLNASYSRNERNDYYTNTILVQSYSPRVSNIAFTTRYRFNHQNSALIGISQRQDRYPEAQGVQRHDHRRTYSVGAQHIFNSKWTLALNYQSVEHNSNQSIYSYHSRLLNLTTRYNW